jgi:hypothetical protein
MNQNTFCVTSESDDSGRMTWCRHFESNRSDQGKAKTRIEADACCITDGDKLPGRLISIHQYSVRYGGQWRDSRYALLRLHHELPLEPSGDGGARYAQSQARRPRSPPRHAAHSGVPFDPSSRSALPESGTCSGDHLVECRRTRLLDRCRVQAVMLGDGTVDPELYRRDSAGSCASRMAPDPGSIIPS